ncbi:MAG: IS200/IS605 family transposase [bacterium]|nr:IS200/IS605 family transposase [bacterium]
MNYYRCYYHFVWATKNRQPTLTVQREPVIFGAIERKTSDLKGTVLIVNAAFDHLHIAVTLPPTLSLAEYAKLVKGVSSHEANSASLQPQEQFRWQTGFGVVTFGAKNLPLVEDYIRRQKEHHTAGTIEPYLEKLDED